MRWIEVEQSANVTERKEYVESRKDTILLFSVMWSEALASIIKVGELDEIKHAMGLPIWAKVDVEEGGVDDV